MKRPLDDDNKDPSDSTEEQHPRSKVKLDPSRTPSSTDQHPPATTFQHSTSESKGSRPGSIRGLLDGVGDLASRWWKRVGSSAGLVENSSTSFSADLSAPLAASVSQSVERASTNLSLHSSGQQEIQSGEYSFPPDSGGTSLPKATSHYFDGTPIVSRKRPIASDFYEAAGFAIPSGDVGRYRREMSPPPPSPISSPPLDVLETPLATDDYEEEKPDLYDSDDQELEVDITENQPSIASQSPPSPSCSQLSNQFPSWYRTIEFEPASRDDAAKYSYGYTLPSKPSAYRIPKYSKSIHPYPPSQRRRLPTHRRKSTSNDSSMTATLRQSSSTKSSLSFSLSSSPESDNSFSSSSETSEQRYFEWLNEGFADDDEMFAGGDVSQIDADGEEGNAGDYEELIERWEADGRRERRHPDYFVESESEAESEVDSSSEPAMSEREETTDEFASIETSATWTSDGEAFDSDDSTVMDLSDVESAHGVDKGVDFVTFPRIAVDSDGSESEELDWAEYSDDSTNTDESDPEFHDFEALSEADYTAEFEFWSPDTDLEESEDEMKDLLRIERDVEAWKPGHEWWWSVSPSRKPEAWTPAMEERRKFSEEFVFNDYWL
ncbi:hypothetical protein P7C70_g6567, partial [Phenoliferia sp. Uapishka_3]